MKFKDFLNEKAKYSVDDLKKALKKNPDLMVTIDSVAGVQDVNNVEHDSNKLFFGTTEDGTEVSFSIDTIIDIRS